MDFGAHGACVDVFVNGVDDHDIFGATDLERGWWLGYGVGGIFAHYFLGSDLCSQGVICVGYVL